MTAALRHRVAVAIAALLLAASGPPALRAAAPDSSAAADSSGAPAALFDSSRGFRLEASRMLGQEDVGGMRHILLDVSLTQGSARVTAPRGYYYQTRDLTALAGDVRLVDTTLAVRADSAAWHRDTQQLEVFGHVVVNDRDLKLEGNRGLYDRRAETIRLEESVIGTEGERIFAGDRLDYRRGSGRLVIEGGARFEDPARHAVVKGGRLDYDRTTGEARAVGNPALDWKRGERQLSVAGRQLRFLEGETASRRSGTSSSARSARRSRPTAPSSSIRPGSASSSASPA